MKMLLVGLFLFGIWLGVWRFDWFLNQRQPSSSRLEGERLEVVDLQETNRNYQKIILEKPGWHKYILVLTSTENSFQKGEILRVSCQLENLTNQQDARSLRSLAQGIGYFCQKPQVIRTDEFNRQGLGYWLGLVSQSLKQPLKQNLAEPESTLASGILFGGSSFIESVRRDFANSGVTHITAVSGYNVTILAECFVLLGIWLGLWRKGAILFALIAIGLFVLMIGLPASAVRAGMMAGVLLWAMRKGRLIEAPVALLFAAAGMLWLNPLLLRYDLGFQLSFLATCGLIWGGSQNYFPVSFWGKVRESLHTTFWAQVFVLPILVFNFGGFSVVSLLANLLILTTIPYLMLGALLIGLADLLWTQLALVLAWLLYWPLKYVVWIAHVLGNLPGATVNWQNKQTFVWLFYYLLLGLLIWRKERIKAYWREKIFGFLFVKPITIDKKLT